MIIFQAHCYIDFHIRKHFFSSFLQIYFPRLCKHLNQSLGLDYRSEPFSTGSREKDLNLK